MFYLGGHRVIGAGWTGPRSVYLDFETSYQTGWLWQLYANRTMIGRTSSPSERRITGQLAPAESPPPLTLIRVDAASILTDFGARLPAMPWNRFELAWTAESFPTDAHHFDVTGNTVPGGDVDPANLLGRVPFAGNGVYTFLAPPVQQSGLWKYTVTPRDDAQPIGNAGTPADIAVTALVPPPDLRATLKLNRFVTSVNTGVLTVRFAYGP